MNLSHLDRDVSEVALEGRGTRLGFLPTSGFVPWPTANEFISEAERRMHGEASSGPPHLFLSAPPLSGVRSTLREIERRGALGSGRRRRAILIDGLQTFSELRVSHAISVALQAAGGMPRNAFQSERQALRAIRDAGTRLLVVRQIDQLPDQQGKRLVRYLSALSSQADFRLALTSSTPDARVFSADAALAARSLAFRFKAWPQEFWVVETVEAALRRLPLRQPTSMTPAFMAVLFGRTHGYAGRVFGLLKAAAAQAIETGGECISEEMLRTVETPFSGAVPIRNRKGAA